jgi:PKD repeat protein
MLTATCLAYAAAPTIDNGGPFSGTTAGGTIVQLLGTNYAADAAVSIGGVPATTTFVDPTLVWFIAPPHPATGNVDITLSCANGTATRPSGYRYSTDPTFIAVAPKFGPAGTTVNLTGENFDPATTTVGFGGNGPTGFTLATNVSVVSPTLLSCVAPSLPDGPVQIVVLNNGNPTFSRQPAFTYGASDPNPGQLIACFGVSATVGSTSGSDFVTLLGKGFSAGMAVEFDGTAASGISVTDTNQLTCFTPALSAGTHKVFVQFSSNSFTSDMIYGAVVFPLISSLDRTSGSAAGSTKVVISGSDFLAPAKVQFGGVDATGVTVNDPSTITCFTGPHAPAFGVDVTVTNGTGWSHTIAEAYTYDPEPNPTVTGSNITIGASAGGTSVTVNGTAFVNGATIKFGTATATAITFVDDMTLTCLTPEVPAGTVDVTVINPSGKSGTMSGAFTFIDVAPTIKSITPSTDTARGGASVTISGSNFVSSGSVSFGGVAATGLSRPDPSTLICTAPAHAVGTVDVTVVAGGGLSVTSAAAFTYTVAAPGINSLSRTAGSSAGGDTLSITGSYIAVSGTVKVTFGGVDATVVNVVSSTSITCVTPAHAAGAADVVVTNPDGQIGTLAAGFLFVDPPVLNGISLSASGVIQNGSATCSADATDPAGRTLTFSWDYGDGSTPDSGNPVTHTFTTAGVLTITCTVSNGAASTSGTATLTVAAPSSGGEGEKNISDGQPPVTNPLNGMTITVGASDGGVIELDINIDALIRDAFSVGTDVDGLLGRVGSATGTHVVQKFTDPGVFVATSTATETATAQPRGKARKTLALNAKETGHPRSFNNPPKSTTVVFNQIKGDFLFGRAGGLSSGNDTVMFSGKIELPEGLDITQPQELALGIGNIIDSVMVDAKGKPKLPSSAGGIAKLQVKYPRLKKGVKLTPAGQTASVTLTLNKSSLSAKGFDTEGITATLKDSEKGLKVVPRSIQVAVVFAGVAYQNVVPVQFKVSPKGDSGVITGRAK